MSTLSADYRYCVNAGTLTLGHAARSSHRQHRNVAKRIYVGNIPWNASEEDVRKLSQRLGAVQALNWVADRCAGMFRGFAFVTTEDKDIDRPIGELSGRDLDGRHW